ncbi:alpha/beta fold hydrolase [Pseudonocardia sp. GCM10023141]|uniref:alpha/beta fold hydrolase n=1 Tax=Pseudonocardia sp. GCM10023141 TaxID=3252653 RepID=UPI0036085DE2
METGRDQNAAVLQLMDALDIERAAIVGNSMGGGIALAMAGLHPERVSHVVTMGSGGWGVSVLSPAGISEGFRALVDADEDPTEDNFRRLVTVMCFDPAFATDQLVVLVHGRDDRTVHYELSLRALAMVPDSRLVLLNRCGHWAQLEHPAEFNRLVDDFLTHG